MFAGRFWRVLYFAAASFAQGFCFYIVPGLQTMCSQKPPPRMSPWQLKKTPPTIPMCETLECVYSTRGFIVRCVVCCVSFHACRPSIVALPDRVSAEGICIEDWFPHRHTLRFDSGRGPIEAIAAESAVVRTSFPRQRLKSSTPLRFWSNPLTGYLLAIHAAPATRPHLHTCLCDAYVMGWRDRRCHRGFSERVAGNLRPA